MNAVKSYKEEGKIDTIIMITHRLHLNYFADEIIFIA
jgi:hypothetical protein